MKRRGILQRTTLYLSLDLYEKLREYAKKTDTTMTEIVETALRKYLTELNEQTKTEGEGKKN